MFSVLWETQAAKPSPPPLPLAVCFLWFSACSSRLDLPDVLAWGEVPCRACDGCAGCSALGIGSCADGRLRARVKLIMRCCVDPQLPGKYGCGRHPAAQRNVALQRECVLLHFSRQGRHGPGARRLWRGVNVIAVAGSVNATPIRAWPHICGLFLGEGSDRHSEEV